MTTRSTEAREAIRSTAINGCDTIIGGYGADKLTGGNGDDRFVYLSAADSSAAQFDVISDFRSGSDRIDLTALGALALSGADVRKHIRTGAYGRLALRQRGKSNHSVRQSNRSHPGYRRFRLLEVHLEGLVTVQASDFVPEPTAAPVMVAVESAIPSWPQQWKLARASRRLSPTLRLTGPTVTTRMSRRRKLDVANGLEGRRLRLCRPDEARTQPANSTNDDEAVASTSGPSVDAHHVHVTALAENSLAPDQTSTHDAGAHNTGLAVLNDDKGASQRIEHIEPSMAIRLVVQF